MSLRRIAAAGFVLGVTACTSVRPVQPDPFIPIHTPGVVWVTYPDNTVVPVAAPDVTGDTLRGMRQGTRKAVAISLRDVRSVQAKVPDGTKTAVFVTGALAGFVASVYVMWIRKAGPKQGGEECGYNEDAIAIPYC